MTEEQIFLAALNFPDHPSRTAYLDEVCGQDSDFRGRVEAMLTAHARTNIHEDESTVDRVASDPQSVGDETVALMGKSDVEARADDPLTDPSPADDDDLHFLSPTTRPDSLGRIGHYEVLEVLGRGGFGIVFRAFDDVLHRVVAVKVLAPGMAATSPARKRFLREARSSAKVRQENIVQVYAVEEKPLPYLVMEFIPGETLQQRLDRIGPLEVPEILRIGRQIAEGLAAAHATDLIHRDIKPSNMLIENGPQARVKITDFGLARAADDASLTQSGVVTGTPMYMAPEQANGEPIDHRADLFSLGSVLYVMATGRPPFRASTTLAVLKRVAEDEPRPIRELIPEVPEWLCGIVSKLHAKDPAARFQTAAEVAEILAACEAKLNAKQEIRNRFPARAVNPSANRRKTWAITVAVVLLPMIALTLTESVGVTHLFRSKSTTDAIGTGSSPPLAGAPFDAARARSHQEAWAKHLGVPVEFTNSIGMKLRLIPPGEFLMGASPTDGEAQPDERPNHKVRLTRPYYLGVHEVTNAQFEAFVKATNYRTEVEVDGKGAWNTADRTRDPSRTWRKLAEMGGDIPVTCLTWKDTQEFCRWLSTQDGLSYRLPTDAEWEYACRAGTTTVYYFGNEPDFVQANVGPDLDGILNRVGSRAPNPFGLFDMHGNAHERCLDGKRAYTADPITDPLGSLLPDSARVTRGGAATSLWPRVRSSHRYTDLPLYANNALGFRVAIIGDLRVKTQSQHKPE